jgi:hypothetical protein
MRQPLNRTTDRDSGALVVAAEQMEKLPQAIPIQPNDAARQPSLVRVQVPGPPVSRCPRPHKRNDRGSLRGPPVRLCLFVLKCSPR